MQTHKLTIKGTVQGVGFRPFVYTLAQKYNIKGTVSNSSNGVEIIVTTNLEELEHFIDTIKNNAPALASIDNISYKEIDYIAFDDFRIIKTKESGDVAVNIPPDVSICLDCEKELFDPNNRRFEYPFITCTNCGVRYSIIYDLPYDRVHTSMKFFAMCKACEEEYSNPIDRRYHAQPIGCWDCGATLELKIKNEKLKIGQKQIVDRAVSLLLEGHIVAVKGVGGYHLICDATNKKAIATLRKRKQRPSKPFAMMVQDMKMARELAFISSKEEEILTSKERPIVIVKSKNTHAKGIAPNISCIGLFLPYTPLHLLLLKKPNRPIVATSANISDEPLATDTKSIEKLSNIYDSLLNHNRKIVNGCDDSVVMVVKNQPIILRRARGYAPLKIELPFKLKKRVLALGANQKSTIAIGFDNQVILSPHIGDLDGIASVEYFRENIENLKRIYRFEPDVVVHDKHPNYESSKYAKTLNIEKVEVQHHYAHILGVMTEKKLSSKVFGVAFDGTGLGDDGRLWGGEFMLCDYKGYKRIAHLNYFKLIGGAKAIKEPKRVALSLLFDLYGKEAFLLDNPTIKAFSKVELNTYYTAWSKSLNSPLSSSVGRLFDAIASLVGVCQVMSFEGESGMRLEELYDASVEGCYEFSYKDSSVDILPLVKEIIKEPNIKIAISKFFHTLVEIIALIYKPYADLPMVLSGGVFQNRVLLELVMEQFPQAVVSNIVPPNDGGIALGQVVAVSD